MTKKKDDVGDGVVVYVFGKHSRSWTKSFTIYALLALNPHVCQDWDGGGAPCFGRRTISFLVKFESSVLCTLLAYIGHLGYFIPHLMNNKADFGFKVLKKLTSKTEKMRKCPKTANFGHVLVYLSNQICFA